MKTKLLVFGIFLFAGVLALAQIAAPPETVEGATALIPNLILAASQGQNVMAAGIAVMVAMVFVRQYLIPKLQLSKEALPLVMAIIPIVSMVGFSLYQGLDIRQAFENAILVAMTAGGAWDLLGKTLTKQLLGKNYVASAESITK